MPKQMQHSAAQIGPAPAGSDRFFDLWLRQSLGARFDTALAERLPEPLLELLDKAPPTR